jgi:8-oxo-dGTP pyrophosphatase MutT (NUDIX family)
MATKVSDITLERINKRIAREHEEKQYRPTVVAVIKEPRGNVLFVRSAKAEKPWGLPQGGVEQGECVVDALFRELSEEVGIPASRLVVQRFLYANRVRIPDRRRDGFQVGKSYYYFQLECVNGIPSLFLQEEEVFASLWANPRLVLRDVGAFLAERQVPEGKLTPKTRAKLRVLEKVVS